VLTALSTRWIPCPPEKKMAQQSFAKGPRSGRIWGSTVTLEWNKTTELGSAPAECRRLPPPAACTPRSRYRRWEGFRSRHGILLAEHRHRQRRDGASERPPLHEGQVRAAIPERVLAPVQPPLRPAEHGAAPRLGGGSHAAGPGETAPQRHRRAA